MKEFMVNIGGLGVYPESYHNEVLVRHTGEHEKGKFIAIPRCDIDAICAILQGAGWHIDAVRSSGRAIKPENVFSKWLGGTDEEDELEFRKEQASRAAGSAVFIDDPKLWNDIRSEAKKRQGQIEEDERQDARNEKVAAMLSNAIESVDIQKERRAKEEKIASELRWATEARIAQRERAEREEAAYRRYRERAAGADAAGVEKRESDAKVPGHVRREREYAKKFEEKYGVTLPDCAK